MDVLDFINKDKKNYEHKPKEKDKPKVDMSWIELTRKDMLDHTLIYKPVTDADGMPYRCIHRPIELRITCSDQQGNSRRRCFEILEDPSLYGPLTEGERKLYDEVLGKFYAINDMQVERTWTKSRKQLTIFYAYSMALVDGTLKQVLEKPTLSLVMHSSQKFLENFHKQCDTKNTVFGTNAWLGEFYDLKVPTSVMTLKTSKANIGFDVTVDFIQNRPTQVTADELLQAKESVKSLNDVKFSNKFDPQWFQDVNWMLNNWMAENSNQHTTVPVDTALDQVQTEIESGEAMAASEVPPMQNADGEIQPPDPNLQMKA